MNRSINEAVLALDELILKDPASRGVCEFTLPGSLLKAARSLQDSRTVMILTGFYISEAGRGETDGPPGAVSLQRALNKIGKKTVIVTDDPNESLVLAAAKALGFQSDLVSVPVSADKNMLKEILEEYSPSHVVSIERPGKSEDGCYYSMRGFNISSYTAALDQLIVLAEERNITTIGLGDGGNEIGMGLINDKITTHVKNGRRIACVVGVDYLITSGITNWGAYALVILLSLFEKRNLLHSEADEKAMIEAMTEVGGVDGNLGYPNHSIDGVSASDHQRVVQEMRRIYQEFLAK